MMLQQDKGDDYVVATGESHSVRECLDVAFGELELDWKNARRDRPAVLQADFGGRSPQGTDPSKAMRVLGWKPKVTFKSLIQMMVRADEEDVRASLAGRAPTS